jgi:hypothetical protein
MHTFKPFPTPLIITMVSGKFPATTRFMAQKECRVCQVKKPSDGFTSSQWKKSRPLCEMCKKNIQQDTPVQKNVIVSLHPPTLIPDAPQPPPPTQSGLTLSAQVSLGAAAIAHAASLQPWLDENEALRRENKGLLLRFTNQDTQVQQLMATNTTLQRDVQSLKHENQLLREENMKLQALLHQLKTQVVTLTDDKKKFEAMFHANDIAAMFVFYFIKPKILPSHRWTDLAEPLAEKKAMLADREITQETFDKWLSTQPEPEVLVPLQELTNARNDIAHSKIRSKSEQDEFLKKMNQYDWCAVPERMNFIKTLLARLSTVQTKRMN